MNTSNITNYKPKDFAEFLREGILKANRTQTNRHYYTYNQHLLNQVTFLRQSCNANELL